MSFATDLAFARAWIRPLTLGGNLERRWAWAVPDGPAAFASYFKGTLKGDNLRLFYPYRPAYDMDGAGNTDPPTRAQFARILDATETYVDAGLKIRLFTADVLTTWEDLDSAGRAKMQAHTTNAAAWIKERNFPNGMVGVGAWNECGGTDDAYPAFQTEQLGILRQALPDHVLFAGQDNWQHYGRLISQPVYINDGRMIWPIHAYEQKDAAGWQAVASQVEAWSQANGGLVATFDEAGPCDAGNRTNYGSFIGNLNTLVPAMAKYRPVLWAFTYGSDYRINIDGGNAHLASDFQAAFIGWQQQLAASLAISDPAPAITPSLPPITLPDIGTIYPPALPDLGGPFGLLGNLADPAAPLKLTALGSWSLSASAALRSYTEQTLAYLNAYLAAEVAARQATALAEQQARAAEVAALQASITALQQAAAGA